MRRSIRLANGTKRIHSQVHLEPWIHTQVHALAQREGHTFSSFVELLILDRLALRNPADRMIPNGILPFDDSLETDA